MIFICLLAAMFAVKAKLHVKHHGLHKASHDHKKDASAEKLTQALVTSETSSQEQEEDVSEERAHKDSPSEKTRAKDSAVLMSEEELEALVKTEEDNEDLEDSESYDAKLEVEAKDQIIKFKAKQEQLFEEAEGSTESELPEDLDYASDSNILQPVKILPAKEVDVKPMSDEDQVNSEAVPNKEDKLDQKQPDNPTLTDSDHKDVDFVPHDATQFQHDMPAQGEEENRKNDSNVQGRKKQRKQKKNQRLRKHSPQKDEAQPEAEQSPEESTKQQPVQSEGNSTDSGAHKTKRRRAGKWGPLVGVNPVQIRATVDLYPSSRAALAGVTHDLEASADPCDNFRCKRGKTCKLDDNNKPSCVCQVPSECPPSLNELDRVCGTDNKTYDTSCQLFATKCNLEGTKRGHRLHLDYTGPCKLIPPCQDTELVQFPLRMRDWLKNVLLQLYEHDTTSPGFLTTKQRFRVKKIYESERRLHAGDHPVELLEQDFEKNYNMYIYPVHWQFAQLDQHPSDRQLSHSELAPLRVPLVPMEHCTSLFFQECDSDKDKQVSIKEWTSCFGIKEEDMDTSLLF